MIYVWRPGDAKNNFIPVTREEYGIVRDGPLKLFRRTAEADS